MLPPSRTLCHSSMTCAGRDPVAHATSTGSFQHACAVQARVQQNACNLGRIARIWLPVSDGSEVRPALSKLRRATKAACTDFGGTHVRVLFHIDTWKRQHPSHACPVPAAAPACRTALRLGGPTLHFSSTIDERAET
jgi:hypothetical protein